MFKNKLKIAILIDSRNISYELSEVIRNYTSSKNFEIKYLLINNFKSKSNFIYNFKSIFQKNSSQIFKIINLLFFKSYIFFEKNLYEFYKFIKLKLFLKNTQRKIQIDKISLFPKIKKSNQIKYSQHDLMKIRDLEIDYIIYINENCYSTNILDLKVLNIYYSNNLLPSTKTSTFYSIVNESSKSNFFITFKDKKLNEKIIFKGNTFTHYIFTFNFIKLQSRALSILFNLIEELPRSDSSLIRIEENQLKTDITKTPTLYELLKYFFSSLNTALNQNYFWGVGYQFTENWLKTDLKKSLFINNPKNRWLADPFVWAHGNEHYCFVEDFSLKKGKGAISVFKIFKDKYKELGEVINEDFHLSYPFIFKAYGDLYMCPATPDIKEIRLYKCVKFPMEWKLDQVLIKDINAGDTNIFHYNQKWWLMTNCSSSKLGDRNSELHIFYSDDLLSQNWKKHLNNPVIFDSDLARNGGLILDGKNIFRIYQKHKFNHYGYATGIAKIRELSECTYAEDYICENLPDFAKNINGTHSFNYHKGLLVFDVRSNTNI